MLVAYPTIVFYSKCLITRPTDLESTPMTQASAPGGATIEVTPNYFIFATAERARSPISVSSLSAPGSGPMFTDNVSRSAP